VLTQAWSGTFALELLGLLGAEVIQIEARRRPDSWRGDYGGTVPAAIKDETKRQRPWNTNGLYNAVNLNKRGVTLDLSDPRGRELFRRLVPFADIVAENFSPRVMGNLGLDYESLRKIKPDIILGSLSAYGATGPYANIPGIGGTIEPMSGMSGLLGYEGGRPQNSGSMYPDPVAGYYFAAALIMALRHRDRTGEGQYIDLGMMEANATMIGDALLEQAANGRVRPRLGNHHLRIAPHNIYPAKDGGWLALSADNEAAWQALCDLMQRSDLAGDPRFATMAARKAHENELDALVAAWAKDQDAATAARTPREHGIAAAPVLEALDVLAEEQFIAREFFVEVCHPEAGTHLQTGVPWRFSRTPARVERPAPMMGEHSREVLAEFLGVTDAEYEELVAAGITGDMPPN
jgi:crotonobetainyl-CoA:carnitine CoA-transferase CaiB-like acyl-CoA transferase